MSISKAQLKQQIKDAFRAEMDQTTNPEASIDRIAEKIATAVAAAIVEGVNTAQITLSNSAGPVAGSITATIK